MTETHNAEFRERTADRRLLPRAEPGKRTTDRVLMEFVDERNGIRVILEERPGAYFVLLAAVFVIGLFGVRYGNLALAPLLYDQEKIVEVAAHMGEGRSYATYDLNVEMRGIRRESIRHLKRTPQVAVLGASHWQEGHSSLATGRDFYNAHVHRDYYEDILAVSEMLLEAGRLPSQMIITIRDNLFTPIDDRTDYLWLPAIPDYRRMARRLGIAPHPVYKTLPTPQWRQSLSLSLLSANIKRWWRAPYQPQVTADHHHPTLDVLLPDGSIEWSTTHLDAFTPESSARKALEFAHQRRDDPPKIDPDGVEAVDRLLAFLKARGVEIYLAHPPFNPIYFDVVREGPYMAGLERVMQVTRDLAAKYELPIIGGFDPAEVGCTSDMYIDAEHSNPACLAQIINEYVQLDQQTNGTRVLSGRGRAGSRS